MATQQSLRVNGRSYRLNVDPDKPLLYTLRDELGLNNPRFGCGLAQCGACTVLLNGQPTRTCVIPTSAAAGAEITTVTGLGTPEHPHPLQTAFIEEQAPQCGYCSNGFLLTAAALLQQNPRPTDAEIREALTGLKCRCGTHMAMLRAIKRAAGASA
jgi:aerobic-type carbon monoxide dehydrogenase small subunit (CoxS/CutS family)